ncbi:hypothetical protein DRE_07495 [Drechslerella stenobrocha 248]|uniref:Uncharacterized protein n=1 Tax=Drechslerella stenobrocha 248 TaxID=1043628 RepID=W7HUM7_9PEZI|nr:hypothetical protein DRE_07495 [Drechslerella stenobrocha 248]
MLASQTLIPTAGQQHLQVETAEVFVAGGLWKTGEPTSVPYPALSPCQCSVEVLGFCERRSGPREGEFSGSINPENDAIPVLAWPGLASTDNEAKLGMPSFRNQE